MKHQKLWLSALIAMLVVLMTTVYGYAQNTNPITDDEVNALAEELYCPVCENVPLDVCPTKACAQWRDLIREKMELGWSERQIKDFFAEQYGDQVLALPPRRGFNWLIYVLPPLILIIGFAFIANIMVKSKKQATLMANARPTDFDPTEDDVINEIEQDLKRTP